MESVKCNYLFITIIMIMINIPYFRFKTYSSVDEFTSLAVPAFLCGYDWSDSVALSSYHGYGFTILLTPFFKLVSTGEMAYFIVIIAAFFLKILLAYLFFYIIYSEFHVKPLTASIATIFYICSPLGPDDTCSLSAMSELPLAFCFLLVLYFSIRAQRSKSFKWSILAGIVLGYSYTIHSRCIIIYFGVALACGLFWWSYRKPMFCWRGLLIGGCISILISFILTKIVNMLLYSSYEGELPNETMTVLKSSGGLLKRLWNMEYLTQTVQTFLSLISTDVLISWGVGAFAISICGYYIIKALWGKERVNNSIFILSVTSLICILGMNFCIALQSAARVVGGNYKWLTYIRYSKPFWIGAYLVAIYALVCEKRKKAVNNIFMFFICLCSLFINRYLSVVLSERYGLQYSVLNRIFYSEKAISVKDYFLVFSLIMFWGMWFLVWMYKKRKASFFLIICVFVYVVINSQQTSFYVRANKKNLEKVNATVDVIRNVTLLDSYYVGDYGRPNYSQRLQYALFNSELGYMEDEILQYNMVLCTDIDNYNMGDHVKKIVLDDNEYLYTSNEKAYMSIMEYISNSDYDNNE